MTVRQRIRLIYLEERLLIQPQYAERLGVSIALQHVGLSSKNEIRDMASTLNQRTLPKINN